MVVRVNVLKMHLEKLNTQETIVKLPDRVMMPIFKIYLDRMDVYTAERRQALFLMDALVIVLER